MAKRRFIAITRLQEARERGEGEAKRLGRPDIAFQFVEAELIIRLRLHDGLRRAPDGGYALKGWNTQWTGPDEGEDWENTCRDGATFYGGLYRNHLRGAAQARDIAWRLTLVLSVYERDGWDAAWEAFLNLRRDYPIETGSWVLVETPSRDVWAVQVSSMAYFDQTRQMADQLQARMGEAVIYRTQRPAHWSDQYPNEVLYTVRKPRKAELPDEAGIRAYGATMQTGLIRALQSG